MSMTRLGLAPKTIKYLMFGFNLFFVITGIALLSIGLVIHGVYYEYQHFLDNSFFSVPSFFIALGSIIFIIAFFGCCGAIRESYCMILMFCTLLIVVLILEIIASTMGYVMRADIAAVAREKMLHTMPNYINSTEIQFVWDNLQKDFKCCGTVNASDWISDAHLSGYPITCCDEIIGTIGNMTCDSETPTLHHLGCMEAFALFAKEHAAKISGVGIGLGAIQLVGIFLSCYLAKSVKNSYHSM